MMLKTANMGCGKVGHFHAKAYQKLDNALFCAVSDRNLSPAQEFAKQYGVKAYDNISEIIKNEGINVAGFVPLTQYMKKSPLKPPTQVATFWSGNLSQAR
nr:Gfo/Idh/MocA family oxidoreductase [Pantoea sp. 201603H]